MTTPTDYKDVVRETGKVIDAEKITGCFYHNMLTENPSVNAYFNKSHQREGIQPKALANAVCAYAANLDNLEALGPAVNRIAEKHVAFDVTPDLYPVVGKYLLRAIKETHDVDEQVLECWGKAYGDLADIFIEVEEGMYVRNESVAGGWRGYKEWTVEKKVVESGNVVSIYFTTDDVVPAYKPGNYITVKSPLIDEDGVSIAPRNYSISDWSDKHLRISVKRETSDEFEDGVYSNWIHDSLKEGDKVEVAFPCGDFFVSESILEESEQLIFVAGGIGITALLTMLKFVAEQDYQGKVQLIHSVQTHEIQSHRAEIEEIVNSRDNFEAHFLYTREAADESNPNEKSGRLDSDMWCDITQISDPQKTTVFLCAPKDLLRAGARLGYNSGIPSENIRYEFFSSQQILTE